MASIEANGNIDSVTGARVSKMKIYDGPNQWEAGGLVIFFSDGKIEIRSGSGRSMFVNERDYQGRGHM